jgi:hypothetical protein
VKVIGTTGALEVDAGDRGSDTGRMATAETHGEMTDRDYIAAPRSPCRRSL